MVFTNFINLFLNTNMYILFILYINYIIIYNLNKNKDDYKSLLETSKYENNKIKDELNNNKQSFDDLQYNYNRLIEELKELKELDDDNNILLEELEDNNKELLQILENNYKQLLEDNNEEINYELDNYKLLLKISNNKLTIIEKELNNHIKYIDNYNKKLYNYDFLNIEYVHHGKTYKNLQELIDNVFITTNSYNSFWNEQYLQYKQNCKDFMNFRDNEKVCIYFTLYDGDGTTCYYATILITTFGRILYNISVNNNYEIPITNYLKEFNFWLSNNDINILNNTLSCIIPSENSNNHSRALNKKINFIINILEYIKSKSDYIKDLENIQEIINI